MYLADDPADHAPVIAIVGAGASGTLAAIYLLREAVSRHTPLRIALIDRHGRHGLGQAYATTHPAHLLNSPAATMSALAGDPGHLARWAAQAGVAHDGFLPRRDRYIADPWEPGALDAAADGSPVAVLGTGLSMLDVAIALTDAHPRTVVHAISRHALLPREHRSPRPAAAGSALPVIGATSGIPSLTRLIREVRASAAAHPGGWQEVVDALRPQIPGLWAQLPEPDQRLFLAHVARYWEVHRHRVPPETARRAAALTSAGRLSVHRGRVAAVSERPGGVRLRIDRGRSTGTELAVGWLVNCTGPASDITATAHPLLRYLLEAGLARPDRLRLGLDTDLRGALRGADGRAVGDIFALGPPLRGSRYETTAIPEIRDQAAALAPHLFAGQANARPGSAA